MMFRTLTADEIDCRVATVSEKGCSLLLYKDARVDMNILDESFGVFGWQREHEMIGDRLYCTVSIFDKDMCRWVSKQDVGTESYTEKEKGQASDSFKRACFNIGIGRELYTAPFIWVKAEDTKIEKKKNGSGYNVSDSFSVKEIGYDDGRKINKLVIVNKKGDIVYSYGKTAKKSQTKKQQQDDRKEEPKVKVISEKEAKVLEKNLNEKQISQWLAHYGKEKLTQLTPEEAGHIHKWIQTLKEKHAQAEKLKEMVDAEQSKTT